MKKTFSLYLAASLLGGVLPVMAQTSGNQPMGQQPMGTASVSQSQTIHAKVTDINRQTREVQLKGPQGNTVWVKVPENAPNFDQLKKGDRVTATYYQSTALSLAKPGEAPPPTMEKSQEMILPGGPGQPPTRVMVNTKQVTATVQNVDYQNRQVTLKGPQGNLVTVQAGPQVQNLNRIKPGDQVTATFTDALGIQISKAQT